MTTPQAIDDMLIWAELVLDETHQLFPTPKALPTIEVSRHYATNRLGTYFRKTNTIKLYAQTLGEWPEDAVLDVIRHEVAHALHWWHDRGGDHGPRWRYWAERVGARPRHAGSADDRLAYAATGKV